MQAGVHVLTMDLRGFGDSGGEPLSSAGFQNLLMKSPADLDMAYEGIVKLSRIRLTDPQDDGLESRREPGMLGVDHRDSA